MGRKVAVRGLPRLAAVIFAAWGAVVLAKGLWDCFIGQPEANFYSPRPWQFVTREQWTRYAGFELAYGLACVFLGRFVWAYANRLPEWVEKEQ